MLSSGRQIHIEGVTGWLQVLVIHELHEGLDPRFLRGFLRRILFDNLSRVLLYPIFAVSLSLFSG